jgi:hypothetical protein
MANSLIALWNRNATFKPLLESRVILYVLFFISLFTLFGYSQQGEYCGALIFLLVGFLTTFFSKNMIVVLFLALAVSSVIYRGVKVYRAEGFETGDDPMDLAESMENVMKQNLMGGDDEIPKKKVMDTKPPKSTKADGKTEAKEEGKDSSSSSGAKKELKNLLELQLKLMSGVSNLQPILKEVQGAVSNLKTQQFLNE